jgi:hypothetical protein
MAICVSSPQEQSEIIVGVGYMSGHVRSAWDFQKGIFLYV